MIELLNTLCAEVRRAWSSPGIAFGSSELKAYSSATLLLSPLPDLPDLNGSWDASVDAVVSRFSTSTLDENEVEQWVEMAREIRQTEPRFLVQRDFFFFSSRRRHTRCGRDWSSDVCSSDLSLGRCQRIQSTQFHFT